MSDYIPMDTIHPKCPNCKGADFQVVNNKRVKNASNSIVMVVCANESCLTVVGCVPFAEAFQDE